MAITGMEILKMLPKTNCRECGLPTCIAFAMSLSVGKIDDSACPYLSDQDRSRLSLTDAPPIKTVTIGDITAPFTAGGDTKMFRHEKAFKNPTGFALRISDNMDSREIDARLLRFEKLRYQRMGRLLRPELIAVKSVTGNGADFCNLVQKVVQRTDARLILLCSDPDILAAGLLHCRDHKPLLHAATAENCDKVAELAVTCKCPVAVRADTLDELQRLSERLTTGGVETIVLDPGARTLSQALEDHVVIRRAAIRQKHPPFGFPTIAFPCEMAGDLAMETVIGAMFVARYAGIVVLSDFQPESLFPLLLQRTEIYNDPEEPSKVPPGVYAINNPGRNAPVLLASSWGLTYYGLTLAAEQSGTPVFICFREIEEPDVMCWCRHCHQSTHKGTFHPVETARYIRDCKLEDLVDHRTIVICARNAVLKSALEKELPEWEIIVGPDRADQLHGFLPVLTENMTQKMSAA